MRIEMKNNTREIETYKLDTGSVVMCDGTYYLIGFNEDTEQFYLVNLYDGTIKYVSEERKVIEVKATLIIE